MYADGGQVSATKLMITVGTEAVVGRNYADTIKETYDQVLPLPDPSPLSSPPRSLLSLSSLSLS
eukprot:2110350-Rhodomonas_salina.1